MAAGTNNMNNLTTLIKRLEAATSRLEDMAMSQPDSPPQAPQIQTGIPASRSIVSPAATGGSAGTLPPPPPAPASAPAAPKPEPVPELVQDFDTIIDTAVVPFVKLCEELGGAISQQAPIFLQAFKAQRTFLLISTKAKKPAMSDPAYSEILKPTSDALMAVQEVKEKNRGKPDYNQITMVAESIMVLAWVQVDPKPYKHVEEFYGQAQFWGNKVLKEFKEKDQKQVDFVQQYYKIFKALVPYVQDSFPHGLLWNPQGIAPLEAAKSVSSASTPSAPAPSAGGPPPPPPPPPGPPPVFDVTSNAPVAAAAGVGAGGLGAVFSELNKGADVTKGLRKVTADEMTHKNPALRSGGAVPERGESPSGGRQKSPVPPKARKPESMRTKKPPRKELDGNKWFIENYDNESSPLTITAEISHSILISRCNKTTIIVKGKANAISVDNCSRLALVVDDLVSSVDVIKAQNLELQIVGTLPTILMDQVDGASVYLSEASKNIEVYSSKCSSINLNLLEGGDDGDYKENPLPEQMRTCIGAGGKLVTEIVEHAG